MSRLEIAQRYAKAGLSLIPIVCDGTKSPALSSWKQYQERRPSSSELEKFFAGRDRVGIAVVCGKVSRNLEVMDFDYPGIFEKYKELLEYPENKDIKQLFEKFTIIRTPGNDGQNRHVLYRCEELDGNQKLAQGPLSELSDGRHHIPTLIETRSEGGYILLPGSHPDCHNSNREYELVQGQIDSVPEVTADERRQLLDLARQLNEYQPKTKKSPKKQHKPKNDTVLPGDDYNARESVADILREAGWTQKGESDNWIRPGKDRGISATLRNDGVGCEIFYIFSTSGSIYPFESQRGYDPFTVYTLLKHSGDFTAAAKELYIQGYGDRAESSEKIEVPLEVYEADADLEVFDMQISESDLDFLGCAEYEYEHGTDENSLIDPVCALRDAVQKIGIDKEEGYRTIIESDAILFHISQMDQRELAATESTFIQAGLTREKVRNIKKFAKDILDKKQALDAENESRNLTTVSHLKSFASFDKSAPVGNNIMMPDKYSIEDGQLVQLKIKKAGNHEYCEIIPIASQPLLITGILEDIVEESVSLRISWKNRGRWRHHIIERAAVADSRKILRLSGIGAPVSSSNAMAIVKYLAEFEAVNMNVLPRSEVSCALGWQPDDKPRGFLAGRKWIDSSTIGDADIDVDKMNPSDWPEDMIVFRGNDSGDNQLSNGFRSKGSMMKWMDAVRMIQDYPSVMLAVYGSLAPILLKIFDTPNFIISWSYSTSSGKSKTLSFAASCWGDPDEKSKRPVLHKWNQTAVWIERAAMLMNSLPLILDDTKTARYPKSIGETIYNLVSGRGRGRGSTVGMRASAVCDTIALTTGERRLTSFTEDGGTRTRVLELWGIPFGKQNAEIAKLIDRIDDLLLDNYGFAGPQFVKYVIKNNNEWPHWKKKFREIEQKYKDHADGNPYSGRISPYLAIIEMTSILFFDCFKPDWIYTNPIIPLYQKLTEEAHEADRAYGALRTVHEWAVSNDSNFFGRHQTASDGKIIKPTGGWAGRWDANPTELTPHLKPWKTIDFIPKKLKDILDQCGHDTDSILRIWADRGYIESGKNGLPTIVKKISGNSARLICIKRDVLEDGEDFHREEALENDM